MKTTRTLIAILLGTSLMAQSCRLGYLSPPKENRIEILSIQPEWLDSVGVDKQTNCQRLSRTHLGTADSLPPVIGLKIHIRYFTDSTEAAYQYQMAHGVDGMVDTLVGIRLGIASASGENNWFGQHDWQANRRTCLDVVDEKPFQYKGHDVRYNSSRTRSDYQMLSDLMNDINHYENMPLTAGPIDNQNWIRVFLFPRPADTIPAVGRLVVELDFASGRRLIGQEDPHSAFE